MLAIIQLAGMCVITYFLILGVVMLFTQCSVAEAQKMIVSWLQENMSGLPKKDYELSRDCNYDREVNSAVEGILGETRYNELCKLATHSSALEFIDNHAGYPTVQITVNCSDRIEARRLQTILESKTRLYVLNYGDPANAKVLSIWSKNPILHLPMLIIMYSRNEKEKGMLDAIAQSHIKKIARKCVARRRATQR